MNPGKRLWWSGVLSVPLILTAHAAGTPYRFSYDRALAVDLGSAYVHSYARAAPKYRWIFGLDFKSPLVMDNVFKNNRRVVEVVYRSSRQRSFAYVQLELCPQTGLLTVIEAGTVDGDFVSYVDAFSKATKETFLDAVRTCPIEGDDP